MLADLLSPGLRVVFCGTAAGKRSAQLRQYYAGRGNKFWKILAKTGLTPEPLRSYEFMRLKDYGLGLTDVVKGQSGMDKDIAFRNHQRDKLRSEIEANAPRVLCFNGKKAALVFLGRQCPDYGLQKERIGKTLIFIAPSTSGAASGFWDEKYWRQLAALACSGPRAK